MNYFSKNKIIFWLLIFLVVINLSALITFLVVFPSRIKSPEQEIKSSTQEAMQELLMLDPSQSPGVDSILIKYRGIAAPLSAGIHECRMKMLNELEQDNPDTQAINKCLLEINDIQGKMQQASVRQYMELKKICTPAQCRKLSSLYFEMYGCKGPGMGQGMGKGKGMMHRNRGGKGG